MGNLAQVQGCAYIRDGIGFQLSSFPSCVLLNQVYWLSLVWKVPRLDQVF